MRPRAAGVRAVAGRVAGQWAGSHQPHGSWPSSRSPQTPFSQAAPILAPHLRPGRAGQRRPERKVDDQGRVSGWSSCSRGQHRRVPPPGLKWCSWPELCPSCCLLREGSRASAGTLKAPSPRGPQSHPEAAHRGLRFLEEQVERPPRPTVPAVALDPGLRPPGPGHTSVCSAPGHCSHGHHGKEPPLWALVEW